MLERPEKKLRKGKNGKSGLLSASDCKGAGPERGLMERCNQSVSEAVTTRFFFFFSVGIGHCTHQGSSEADHMGEQWQSFSLGTCYSRCSG